MLLLTVSLYLQKLYAYFADNSIFICNFAEIIAKSIIRSLYVSEQDNHT